MPRLQWKLGGAPLLGGTLCITALTAGGQDFSRRITRADNVFGEGIVPSGLGMLTPGGDLGLKGEFEYAIDTRFEYDSNITLGRGGSEEEEFSLNLTPSITYTSDPEGGAINTITAYYAPTLTGYLEDFDRSSVDHSGGVSFVSKGARGTFNSFADYAQNSGADRFTGTFSEATIIRLGAGISYRVAPKTTLFSTLTFSSSDYSRATETGAEVWRARAGFFHNATPRLAFGPSILFSYSQSGNLDARRYGALNGNIRYEVTDRVDLSATFGVGYATSSSPSTSEIDYNIDVSMSYWLNERWTFSGGLLYDTFPAPTLGNALVSDLALRASATRSLDHGAVSLAVQVGHTDYESSGPGGAAPRDDSLFWSVAAKYTRPFANDRATWTNAITWSQTHGGTDWDRLQVSTGVTIRF